MWTTGAPSTGADEHPASTAHALNAAIVDGVERFIFWRYLLLRLVGHGVSGEGGHERLLRHLHPTDGLHPLLAFFLLLQQLALARDVTALTLRYHVFADRADVFASNDLRTDGRLHRNFELLARNQFLEFGRHLVAVGERRILVHDRAERVNGLALQQDVDLHQLRFLLACRLVIEAGVAAGARLQRIEEVKDDLPQRHCVAQLHPLGRQVVHAAELAPPRLAQFHDRADEFAWRDDRRLDDGFEYGANLAFWPVRRVGDDDLRTVLLHNAIH